MILKQYYLGCLAHASYLIGDEKTGIAAVVDPQRDIEHYLQDAAEHGLQIRHVFLTHFHADFISGHLELQVRCGATIYLGARAEAEYAFVPLKEGDRVEFGSVRLQAMETPGHTPEAISILVYDLVKSGERPEAVLTGDTLFIGDVGRPDLLASVGVTGEDLASMLYDSLHHKLLNLPDQTLVYPAHGAGSRCGRKLSTDRVSTIGDQRRYNYALQPMSKAEFVKLVTANQPEAPAYFGYDAMLNRQERPTLDESLARELTPLSVEDVTRLVAEGAQALDVRDAADYAGGHLAGSLNIGLGGKFAIWAGSILARERPIVLIAEPGREREAATRLGRIGFDQVAGYLKGGMAALEGWPALVRRVDRVAARTLAEQLAGEEAPLVLDVRDADEWQEHHIEGSLNIPVTHLHERLSEVPKNRPIAVHCASGYRSSIAAGLLEQAGYEQVMDLVGGMEAWKKVQPVAAGQAGQGATA